MVRCICLIAWVVMACQETVVDIQTFDYYPINKSKTKIFKVKEQLFEINDDPITNNYFLRETISNIEVKPNEENFLVERSKSKDGINWKIDSVWVGRKTITEVVISENSIEKVKIIFPVRDNSKFNINKYNTSKPTEARLKLNNEPFQLAGLKLENLVSIIIADDSTLIDKSKLSETYAPEVGLIYKSSTILEYCQTTPDCIGKGIISRGIIYEQTLLKTEN